MRHYLCVYVNKARNNFESTRAEVERLMKRIRSAEEDFKAPGCFTMEGYLYIQEKRETHICHILSLSFLEVLWLYFFFILIQVHRHENVVHFRSPGQCVDKILLHLWKKLQDVHHEQHRIQISQQTGGLVAPINNPIKFLLFNLPH